MASIIYLQQAYHKSMNNFSFLQSKTASSPDVVSEEVWIKCLQSLHRANDQDEEEI